MRRPPLSTNSSTLLVNTYIASALKARRSTFVVRADGTPLALIAVRPSPPVHTEPASPTLSAFGFSPAVLAVPGLAAADHAFGPRRAVHARVLQPSQQRGRIEHWLIWGVP